MVNGHSPRQNRLLAALPATEYWRLAQYLELVQMPYGAVIHDSAQPLHHLYFPTSAIVSLQYVMVDGASSEITGIGNEGMVGIAVFTGGETMPGHAKVLFGGDAYRVPSRVVRQELNRPEGGSDGLYHILLRYTQARLTQISQIVACNRHHLIEQRLSRWLLSSLDRLPSAELNVTQEAIAGVLGVRRESITATVGRLQQAGFIHIHRGHIRVLERTGLEEHACECYQVVKKEIDRLLPNAAMTQATVPHYGSVRRPHRWAG